MATALPLGGFLWPRYAYLAIDRRRAPGLGQPVSSGGTKPERHDAAWQATFRGRGPGLDLLQTRRSYGTGRFQGRSEVLARRLFSPPCRRPGLPPLRGTKAGAVPWRWVEAGLYARSLRGLAAGLEESSTGLQRTGARPATTPPGREGPCGGSGRFLWTPGGGQPEALEPGAAAPWSLILQRAGRPWHPACQPAGPSFPCRSRRPRPRLGWPSRLARTPASSDCLQPPGPGAAQRSRPQRPALACRRGVGSTAGWLPRIEPLLVRCGAIRCRPAAPRWLKGAQLGRATRGPANPRPCRTVSQAETSPRSRGLALESSEVGALFDRQAIALPVADAGQSVPVELTSAVVERRGRGRG